MIRVVSFDDFETPHLQRLCKLLYQAFGVGCEPSERVRLPEGLTEPVDPNKALELAPKVRTYQDDKVLFLTSRKLKDRPLPSGSAPTIGHADYGRNRAIISTAGIKNLEDGMKLVARNALHQVGHLWELHHCLDPRCAMYPTWTPSFLTGDALFCVFCREKSEQKIRLAKS